VTVKFTELSIDCNDVEPVAEFWAAALHYEIAERGEDSEGRPWVFVKDPAGGGPGLTFATVPETKTVKNRIHIDVNPSGADQAAEVERLLGLGARRADVGQGPDVRWVVLADPEGNEFCVLASQVD
jgi:predicted enzyme related to lactoylglutathione lyase